MVKLSLLSLPNLIVFALFPKRATNCVIYSQENTSLSGIVELFACAPSYFWWFPGPASFTQTCKRWWFGHLIIVLQGPLGCPLLEVFYLIGGSKLVPELLEGSHYISHSAMESLGTPQDKLKRVAVEKDVEGSLLSLLPPWMDGWKDGLK